MELIPCLPLLSEQGPHPGNWSWGTPGGGSSCQRSPFLRLGSKKCQERKQKLFLSDWAEQSTTSPSLIVIFEPQLNGSTPIHPKRNNLAKQFIIIFFLFVCFNKCEQVLSVTSYFPRLHTTKGMSDSLDQNINILTLSSPTRYGW